MKIRIEGDELHAIASWAAKLTPANPSPPIVGGVLLTATDDDLTLSATDTDVCGTVTAHGGAVFAPGQVVVSAKLLAGITRLVSRADDVTLVADDSSLVLSRGKAVWRLPLMDVGLYPATPAWGDELGRIPGDVLRDALRRVLPAINTAATPAPPATGGCELTLSDTLTLAATDSLRLAIAEIPWQPTLTEETRQLVVPGPLLAALRDVTGSTDVALHADDNTLGMVSTRHRVIGRLLAGRFPPWTGILSRTEAACTSTAVVDTNALLTAVRGVGVVAPRIRLQFTPEGIQVAACQSGEHGDAEDEVPIQSLEGDPVTLWVNPHYVTDALSCVDAPRTVLSLNDVPQNGCGFLLRPAEIGGTVRDGYQHVVMPMKAPITGAET